MAGNRVGVGSGSGQLSLDPVVLGGAQTSPDTSPSFAKSPAESLRGVEY